MSGDFESAAEAIVSGDIEALRALLRRDPALAGLHIALAETLLDRGAAEMLAARGAPITLPAAAGLGRVEDVARLLPAADPESRRVALALTAQHGHAEVVRLLLDAGEDANRYNPDGYQAHSTPLHQAVWSDHLDVVKLLVERGARL